MSTIVAPSSNASKWQMGFNSAFKGLIAMSCRFMGKWDLMLLFLNFTVNFMTCLCLRTSLDVVAERKISALSRNGSAVVPHRQKVIFCKFTRPVDNCFMRYQVPHTLVFVFGHSQKFMKWLLVLSCLDCLLVTTGLLDRFLWYLILKYVDQFQVWLQSNKKQTFYLETDVR